MRVLITTWGSLGDLHPYLAVALGLEARGHEAIVATAECYRSKVESLGLGFRPVRPDCTWLEDPASVRRMAHPRWGVVRAVRVLLAHLRESYADTLAAVDGVALIFGNMAAYAAALVAEKTGIAWVSAMHIPVGIFSAYDPPLIPGFPGISKGLRPLGPRFWGPFGRSVNRSLRGLAEPWDRVRKEVGLPRARGFNPLTESFSPALHLALFSRRLYDQQPDWPRQAMVTGFPWFETAGDAALSEELSRFLDEGEPPLVFTLGTAIVTDPGRFYHDSAVAAARLGRRAVLVAKHEEDLPAPLPSGSIAVRYASFSRLFPRAAAIVHHGGIGTTALAMRSGRPSLIMPCAWDQPDNAARAERLGIARTIARNRYRPSRVAAELERLLADRGYADRAAELAVHISQEDGVKTACDAIESFAGRGDRSAG